MAKTCIPADFLGKLAHRPVRKDAVEVAESRMVNTSPLTHDHSRVTILLCWALAALTVAGTVASEALNHAWGGRAAQQVGGPLIDYLPLLATGVYVMWQQPHNLAARRLLLAGSLLGLDAAAANLLALAYEARGTFAGIWLANSTSKAVGIAFGAAVVALAAVFPDGKYQRRYERWIVRFWAACIVTIPLLELITERTLSFNPWMVWVQPVVASPFYVAPLSWLDSLVTTFDDQTLIPFFLAAGLLALRYRRFGPETRKQIKWPLLGLMLFIPVPVVGLFVQQGWLPAGINGALFVVAIVFLPITVGIGIVRHRLLDIDLVIQRSLVYGVLWMAIALAYAGLAALLGVAAGRRFPVAVAVGVTIAATMAFQPARVWLERLADRWIFGHRFGRYETVRRLGAAVDWTLGLEPLGARIASTIREAMPVAWVRIVVEQAAADRRRARVIGVDGIAAEDQQAPDASAALTAGDDVVGRIECGLKPRRSWTTSDDDLLKSLARQAAMAIRSSLLAEQLAERLEELAASRARIVRAEDAERRRIERNIHDGIQQDLVALMANLGLARAQLARDPSAVDASLARLQEDARAALAELREIARGIHPPVLTDRGILEAIEARTARMPLGVGFEIDRNLDGARFPGDVEAAAYFLVCEALTNAAKHSGVQEAKVRITRSDEGLLVEVVDHGRGFDPQRAQRSGLSGIADRVEALGGKFQVRSAPGSGTVVSAALPVPQSSA